MEGVDARRQLPSPGPLLTPREAGKAWAGGEGPVPGIATAAMDVLFGAPWFCLRGPGTPTATPLGDDVVAATARAGSASAHSDLSALRVGALGAITMPDVVGAMGAVTV